MNLKVFRIADFLLISASHSRGLKQLRTQLVSRLEAMQTVLIDGLAFDDAATYKGIRVAVVGRPNVGKSTLVNRLLGEERQVVFDMPGTTKDAIDIPFAKDGVDLC